MPIVRSAIAAGCKPSIPAQVALALGTFATILLALGLGVARAVAGRGERR